MEELIAEIGSSYLCAYAGIESKVLDNQAAYISSWLKNVKDDKLYFIKAVNKAKAATDYILGSQG